MVIAGRYFGASDAALRQQLLAATDYDDDGADDDYQFAAVATRWARLTVTRCC